MLLIYQNFVLCNSVLQTFLCHETTHKKRICSISYKIKLVPLIDKI